jgi:hypothetical protein
MIETNPGSAFLTDAQLCGLLHVDPRTTLRWRRDGGGPRFIRAGERRILYARRDVDEWVNARSFISLAEEINRTDNQK